MQDVEGIYVLSPQGKMILENEKNVMELSVDPESHLSKVPVEVVNKILVNNNPHYVNRYQKSVASPLSTRSVNGGRKRCKRSKKNKNTNKRRRNKKQTKRKK